MIRTILFLLAILVSFSNVVHADDVCTDELSEALYACDLFDEGTKVADGCFTFEEVDSNGLVTGILLLDTGTAVIGTAWTCACSVLDEEEEFICRVEEAPGTPFPVEGAACGEVDDDELHIASIAVNAPIAGNRFEYVCVKDSTCVDPT